MCLHTWAWFRGRVLFTSLLLPSFNSSSELRGLLSTSPAEMAFDNGLNRQMPGRHLAIDQSREPYFNFPWNPPGEPYLKPVDWPASGPPAVIILSSFHHFTSMVLSLTLMFSNHAALAPKSNIVAVRVENKHCTNNISGHDYYWMYSSEII